jgi:hypothetical protein
VSRRCGTDITGYPSNGPGHGRVESYEEHHVADVLCFEPSPADADDERFEVKTMVLIESVTHHIDERNITGYEE